MADLGDKDAPDDPAGLMLSKRDFIQTFFKRAGEFTEELMRENERLRYRVVQLEEEARGRAPDPASPGTLRELAGRIAELEREREGLLARYHTVELSNQDFAARYHEIERENNSLANLYVASYQLHSSLDLRELTRIVLEILINFVGAKTFAVLLLDEERGLLRPLAAEGIAREQVPAVRRGEGVIGAVVASGKAHLGPRVEAPEVAQPMIVTPLRIKDRVVGAIVIWELLAQKAGLVDVDFELFNLLAAHAASALMGAKLVHDLGGRAAALWGAVDLV